MPIVGISKAPDDPEEKKKWANQLMRLQLAFYVDDGATCSHCKHKYESVDDFIAKSPKKGYDKDFVCSSCWEEYKTKHPRGSS